MCEEQATRILLGQYHVRAEGRDGELMAKDRYEVARAYLELSKRLRETENRNAELLAACRLVVDETTDLYTYRDAVQAAITKAETTTPSAPPA